MLKKHTVQILVVTFEGGYFAKQYAQETGITWPLLIDEKRELYREYEILSASCWDIWGPRTWWVYFKEIVQGHMSKKSTGDISQRGGEILIDPSGIIRLHHVGDGPADRPSVASILQVIEHSNQTLPPVD